MIYNKFSCVGFLAFIARRKAQFSICMEISGKCLNFLTFKNLFTFRENLFVFSSHGVMFNGKFFFVIELINFKLFKEGKKLFKKIQVYVKKSSFKFFSVNKFFNDKFSFFP